MKNIIKLGVLIPCILLSGCGAEKKVEEEKSEKADVLAMAQELMDGKKYDEAEQLILNHSDYHKIVSLLDEIEMLREQNTGIETIIITADNWSEYFTIENGLAVPNVDEFGDVHDVRVGPGIVLKPEYTDHFDWSDVAFKVGRKRYRYNSISWVPNTSDFNLGQPTLEENIEKVDTFTYIFDCRSNPNVAGTNVEGKVVVGPLGGGGFSETIPNGITIDCVERVIDAKGTITFKK